MTAAAQVIAQLDLLLAATPSPRAEAEPDDLLTAFDDVAAARAPLIAALAETAPAVRDDPQVLARYQELVQRDRAWDDALVRARRVVGDRLTAVRRARAYR